MENYSGIGMKKEVVVMVKKTIACGRCDVVIEDGKIGETCIRCDRPMCTTCGEKYASCLPCKGKPAPA